MKQSFVRIFVLSAVSLLLTVAAFPQDEREKRAVSAAGSIYVISAKAGGVNFVSGKVAVARKDTTGGYLLKGDELQKGDKVSTGADGKIEILLNPGSYVRLGENTEFEFVTTSLDDLKIKISRGSAIFEVIADNEFRVAVTTPKADFYAVKSGIYRVDVTGDGTGKIEVWKGRAEIGDGQSPFLKSGQTATVSGGQAAISKFDRDDKDSLEAWSKERAKELAKINSRLNRVDLRNSLLANNRWSIYDSYGLWILDPYSRGFCFLPFGSGWGSPYGYWFGRDIWDIRFPYYFPPMQYPGTGGTTQNQTNNQTDRTPRNPAVNQSNNQIDRTPRDVIPPYARVQRDVGGARPLLDTYNPYNPPTIPMAPPPIYNPPTNTGVKPSKDN